MNFFIKGLTKGKSTITYFRRLVRIINNLGKVNILVRIDIFSPKEITLNVSRKLL